MRLTAKDSAMRKTLVRCANALLARSRELYDIRDGMIPTIIQHQHRLGSLRLLKASHAMDAAKNAVGWELAEAVELVNLAIKKVDAAQAYFNAKRDGYNMKPGHAIIVYREAMKATRKVVKLP